MTALDQDLVDRLLAAANEGKETIRQLHEARRDARTVMAELRELVGQVKAQTIEGHNELSMMWWREAMERIDITALGAGLKASFDQWLHQLEEARAVLEGLHTKDAEFATLLDKARKRGML